MDYFQKMKLIDGRHHEVNKSATLSQPYININLNIFILLYWLCTSKVLQSAILYAFPVCF